MLFAFAIVTLPGNNSCAANNDRVLNESFLKLPDIPIKCTDSFINPLLRWSITKTIPLRERPGNQRFDFIKAI